MPYYVKDLLTQVLMHFFIHENTQDGKGDRSLFVRQDYVTELMFLCLHRPKLIIFKRNRILNKIKINGI